MAIKYKWLAEMLRKEADKLVKSGTNKFPTESEISQKYGVSRQTVREAEALLIKEGLISKTQGSGAYINAGPDDFSSNRIALIFPSEEEYIFPSLITDIKSELLAHGYEADVYVTEYSVIKERDILKELISIQKRPVGIIAEGVKTALPNPNLDLYRRLMQLDIPVIFSKEHFPGLSGECYIGFDDLKDFAELAKHISLSSSNMIGGFYSRDDYSGIQRYEHHVKYCIRHDIPCLDNQFIWYDSSLLTQLRKTKNPALLLPLLSGLNPNCHTLICHSDEIAYFTALAMPGKFNLYAFDRSYLSSNASQVIHSLESKPHLYGNTAAQMIISRISNKRTASEQITRHLANDKSIL